MADEISDSTTGAAPGTADAGNQPYGASSRGAGQQSYQQYPNQQSPSSPSYQPNYQQRYAQSAYQAQSSYQNSPYQSASYQSTGQPQYPSQQPYQAAYQAPMGQRQPTGQQMPPMPQGQMPQTQMIQGNPGALFDSVLDAADLPQRLRPLSVLDYVGYTVLYLIPIVGIIMDIYYSIKADNLNLKNYSRALLFFRIGWVALEIVIAIIAASTGGDASSVDLTSV